MKPNGNIALLVKILLIGGLLVVLAYLFHPDSGWFRLLLNGEPVAEPLAPIAVVPTVLIMLFLTGCLMLLVFFGMGFFILIGALLFSALLIGIFAPFFWPLLVIVFLAALFASIGSNKR